jgi:hypothetical protein
MELLLLLLIPIAQIFLTRKRLKGKINISILSISLLMILATIPVGIITIVLCEYSITLRSERLKCDPTILGVICIAMLLNIFIIPTIGAIGRAMWRNEKYSAPLSEKNPYSLRQSYSQNIE